MLWAPLQSWCFYYSYGEIYVKLINYHNRVALRTREHVCRGTLTFSNDLVPSTPTHSICPRRARQSFTQQSGCSLSWEQLNCSKIEIKKLLIKLCTATKFTESSSPSPQTSSWPALGAKVSKHCTTPFDPPPTGEKLGLKGLPLFHWNNLLQFIFLWLFQSFELLPASTRKSLTLATYIASSVAVWLNRSESPVPPFNKS